MITGVFGEALMIKSGYFAIKSGSFDKVGSIFVTKYMLIQNSLLKQEKRFCIYFMTITSIGHLLCYQPAVYLTFEFSRWKTVAQRVFVTNVGQIPFFCIPSKTKPPEN